MTITKNILSIVILSIAGQTFCQAGEPEDAQIFIENDTKTTLRLELTVKESSVISKHTRTWKIPPGRHELTVDGKQLVASTVQYSLKKPNGMRTPGDPFRVFVVKANGRDTITIRVRDTDKFRYPTAAESRQYQEYVRMQADFQIEMMRMVNDAWDF